MSDRLRTTSKLLSLLLRHAPQKAGLTLDTSGWVRVEDLLAGLRRLGQDLTRGELDQLVATNDKQRFAFSADGQRIRASQGHSVHVDLGLVAEPPPAVLWHGTTRARLAAIWQAGLVRGTRQHVHLSADPQTARVVGGRRGAPVVLRIDAAAMHGAGHALFRSKNGVWLTDHVPARFLSE